MVPSPNRHCCFVRRWPADLAAIIAFSVLTNSDLESFLSIALEVVLVLVFLLVGSKTFLVFVSFALLSTF